MSAVKAMSGGGSASTTPDEKSHLWSILPSFDPQNDDPREYRDKVKFLHSICPKKDRSMLAPRLAMLLKGTAWAQVRAMNTEKLVDPENGVTALLQAISTWEEAEEMQLYDKFEKALYRTTQKSDESTQSFVNRMSVAFHELGDTAVQDIRAFILLRQASLSTEDKKRVLTMVGSPLKPDKVEQAMRQLSTKVLVGQSDGKKRVYPVNFTEDEPEEVHMTMETEPLDEEFAIAYLAEQGDEEAQMIREFEEQLIEVCQENQDLATCYSAYADARAKIRDRLRHRGFWPSYGSKGRGKGGKKGGRSDGGKSFRKRDSLAERIASSNCRRCGQRGHWKWECPAKDVSGSKEEVHITETVTFSPNDMEIVDVLPDGVQGAENLADLVMNMDRQDWESLTCPPLGIVFNSTVNEEFTESVFVCTMTRQKVNGHCLGSVLLGAMSRKTDGDRISRDCPGIIDTGASKTVIGQKRVKTLIQSMSLEVQKKMSWKKSETLFRFGNNAVLPSVGALYLPFGDRWMRIEVVEGDTPFLLSNSFLRAIDADVCTRKSLLRLNQLGTTVPLRSNDKGLFVIELAEVIEAFNREHTHQSCQNLEVVTNVTTETEQLQHLGSTSQKAKVAQRPFQDCARQESTRTSVLCHGDQPGLPGCVGSATPISGGSGDVLYDGEDRGGRQEASRCPQPEAVGCNDPCRGETQEQDLPGSDDAGPRVCSMDEETSEAVKRLGHVIPELRQGLGSDSSGNQQCVSGGSTKACGQTQEDRNERMGTRRGGADLHRRGVSGSSASTGSQAQGRSSVEQTTPGTGSRGDDGSRGESGDGEPASSSGRSFTRSAGPGHQEHESVKEYTNNSKVVQMECVHKETLLKDLQSHPQVSSKTHEVLCHLEEVAQRIEQEVNDLVAHTSDANRTRQTPRAEHTICSLDLLEVYCEPDSNLTNVLNTMGLKAKRFTVQDGDLSTAAGREKLWQMVEEEQPRHIWVAPECKYWGNFSRWNSGRSLATAANIQQGREQQRVHLRLCCELYWHQVSFGRHFHLEQPQGSEAMEQKELFDVVTGTFRTVFDMCEVGELKIPKGNNYLRKRTVVLTTSKEFHSLLDARYCRKNHQHDPILGQAKIAGRWQNLSSFAAKYSKGFARNVGYALMFCNSVGERPVVFEELCVPCFGVEPAEQFEMAGEIVKRRKYSSKQGPRPGEDESLSNVPAGLRYGPALTWKDLFKLAHRQAPRVGSVVCESGGSLFQGVSQLISEFHVTHVEVCRGTERYRLPKEGVDTTNLKFRQTIILNRESGEVEVLGPPEE